MAIVQNFGIWTLFCLRSFSVIPQVSNLFSKTLHQVYSIGAQSLVLILLISLFTGLVLGLQSYYAMSMFGAQAMLGSLLSLSLIRELGPTLTAIMLAGRAGSAMTAEIGVMRISDQVDALEVMDINPLGFLVTPRVLASAIVFPLLTAIFNTVGIFGGYLSACVLLPLNEGTYFAGVESSVRMDDIEATLIKALIFGLIVVFVSCYQGYNVHLRKESKGAEAVGNATTTAVVLSSILVLVADYVLTTFLLI